MAGTSWYYIIPPCTWSYTCAAPIWAWEPCVHSTGTWEALIGKGRFHEAPLPCKLGFQHQQSTGYLRVQDRAIHCPASHNLSLVRRPMGYGGGETWSSQSKWTLSPLLFQCDVGPLTSPLGASGQPCICCPEGPPGEGCTRSPSWAHSDSLGFTKTPDFMTTGGLGSVALSLHCCVLCSSTKRAVPLRKKKREKPHMT